MIGKVNRPAEVVTTRNHPNVRNLSSSNPNSQATIIKRQNQNDAGKVCEDDVELIGEEIDGIHGTDVEHFGSEPINDETESILEGVPKICSGIVLESEQIKVKRKSSSAKEPQASIKQSRLEKKLKNIQKSSEELKNSTIEVEKKKEISYRYSLKSYLAMCMQQNMVYKAMMLLRNYHAEKKYIKTSEVYDAVLKEAATHSSWKLIKEIVAMMEEGGIPFSLDSFAACFVCLGRRTEQEAGLVSLSENLLDKMVSCGLSVEHIFTTCKFTSNHRELAVKGVRLALPDFEPTFPSIPSAYITPLLDSLNDLKVDSVIPSPVSGLLTEDEYKFFFFFKLSIVNYLTRFYMIFQ